MNATFYHFLRFLSLPSQDEEVRQARRQAEAEEAAAKADRLAKLIGAPAPLEVATDMTTLSLAENSRTKLDYHALGMGEPEPFWQPEYEVAHDPLSVSRQTRAERKAEVGIQRTLVLPAVHVRDRGEGMEGVEPRLDGPGLAFLDDESDGQEMRDMAAALAKAKEDAESSRAEAEELGRTVERERKEALEALF